MTPAVEAHVAGLVVHAYPQAAATVARRVASIRGAHVHAQSPDGKLVVTLMADSPAAIADALCRIQTLDGVLAAALVYQHSEPEAELDEEVDLEDHTP